MKTLVILPALMAGACWIASAHVSDRAHPDIRLGLLLAVPLLAIFAGIMAVVVPIDRRLMGRMIERHPLGRRR